MSFRILSGDISPEYKLFDSIPMADGRPNIFLTKHTVIDFQALKHYTNYYFSWWRGLLALAFGLLCFSFVGTVLFIAVASIRMRRMLLFRMTVLSHGTFVASVDKDTYQKFLKSFFASAPTA